MCARCVHLTAKRTKIKKDTNTFLGTEDNAEEGDVGGKVSLSVKISFKAVAKSCLLSEGGRRREEVGRRRRRAAGGL